MSIKRIIGICSAVALAGAICWGCDNPAESKPPACAHLYDSLVINPGAQTFALDSIRKIVITDYSIRAIPSMEWERGIMPGMKIVFK